MINCPTNFEVKCDTPLSALSNLVSCTGDTPGFNVRVYDTVFGAGNLAPIANLLNNTNFTTDVFTNPVFDYNNAAALMADYPGVTDGNTFSIAWEGVVVIDTDDLGFWSFGTASDDGSMVYIDLNRDGDFADAGELIVNNNGNHGRRERIGDTCFFTPGCYPIVIAMYEQGGGENMEFKFGKGAGLSYAAMSFADGSATSSDPFFRSGSESPMVATATDNCDSNPTVGFSDQLDEGDCEGEFVLSRTWFAIDACGNSNSCVQTITLRDTEAPGIDGAITLTVECNTTGGFLDDNTVEDFFEDLVAIDNCDPTPELDIDDVPSFFSAICGNAAGETILVTLSDDCGNDVDVNVTVRAVDTIAPVITDCPANVTVECNEDFS
ncbi:MAG: hypothetical protein AAF492_27645, partial [Verrucomicrobiota bacterium]